MFPLLLLLFIIVPIAELYVIIQVGQAIGAGWTILILLADSVLGSLLMRSQGRAAWRRFNRALAEGRAPAREVLDGVLVIFGGALLLTPGFITDVFGILFLLPPTRAVVRRLVQRSVAHRVAVAVPRSAAEFRARRMRPRRPGGPGGPVPGEDFDVEGSATEVDQRHLP
jgi:UPF0716 protein FxsA